MNDEWSLAACVKFIGCMLKEQRMGRNSSGVHSQDSWPVCTVLHAFQGHTLGGRFGPMPGNLVSLQPRVFLASWPYSFRVLLLFSCCGVTSIFFSLSYRVVMLPDLLDFMVLHHRATALPKSLEAKFKARQI